MKCNRIRSAQWTVQNNKNKNDTLLCVLIQLNNVFKIYSICVNIGNWRKFHPYPVFGPSLFKCYNNQRLSTCSVTAAAYQIYSSKTNTSTLSCTLSSQRVLKSFKDIITVVSISSYPLHKCLLTWVSVVVTIGTDVLWLWWNLHHMHRL